MKYYLVDYESVHYIGLNGLEKLSEDDRLMIFYTENSNKLTFDVYEKLIQCKAEIQFNKIECGERKALNIHLLSNLGYLIGQNPESEFIIISKDRDYEYAVNLWKLKKIIIKMASDVMGNIADAIRI